jgi:hypothetical protein
MTAIHGSHHSFESLSDCSMAKVGQDCRLEDEWSQTATPTLTTMCGMQVKRRTLLRPALPAVIQPRGGNVGMPQPLLHLSNVGIVRQRIGCRGGTQCVYAEAVHVATGAVSLLPRVFDASLSASSLFLGRHQDHQTGCRLADLLGGPTEDNIQQTSFTMTA